MKKNYKNLLSNIGVFSLANFTTKILMFLILPLYTGFLTTEEFGTIDLITTLIQLLYPIITLTISDAVLRYAIDDPRNGRSIFTIGVKVIGLGIIPLTVILIIARLFIQDEIILISFALIFILQSFFNLFGAFAKAINKTKKMAIISTITSILILGLNVVSIAVLKLGLNGYLYANILGYLCGDILYVGACRLNRYYIFRYSIKNNEYVRTMLKYSMPLIPNAIFWWVNSSLDRWTLTVLSGLSYVGLYAAANKIPTIISSISTIFSQAWNLSLFQSKEGVERTSFFKTMFDFFGDFMFCVTLALIMLTKVIGKVIFLNDFYEACFFVPLLTMGVYYNSLNSFLGSIFTSNKETKYIFTTTACGAGVNCALNFVLVIMRGPVGAAIATLVSYLVVFVMRVEKVRRIYELKINYSKVFSQFVILLTVTVLATMNKLWPIIVAVTVLYCAWFLYSLIRRAMINKNHIDA